MAGYNPNFAPWQGYNSVNPGGLSTPTFQGLGTSSDQELIAQEYAAQQNLTAINKAARLKHLRDLNQQYSRMGIVNGVGADSAVNMAERPGQFFNPNQYGLGGGGFGAPGVGAVPWTPPVGPGQRASYNPAYASPTVDPYPRYGQTGSPQGGGQPPAFTGGGLAPTQRSNYLNSIGAQVAQDQQAAFRDSLYTPLEPYLSPFDKQLALAEAKGGSARPPGNYNNSNSANAAAQAQAAARGSQPTANATLTDNRVRQENDTRQATKLIENGSITSMKDLQDQFPDADWSRLGGLLKTQQQGASGDYQSSQRYVDQANQVLDDAAQAEYQKQADLAYSKGLQGLHWWNSKQPLKDAYNDTVLTGNGVDYTPDQKLLSTQEKMGGGLIQYDPESGSFVSTVNPVTADPAFQPGYVSRQDMPGQNFHTDLQRSPVFGGLPIVRTQADYASLPFDAQAVTDRGRVLDPKGGRRTGPMYAQPRARQGMAINPPLNLPDLNAPDPYRYRPEIGGMVGFGGDSAVGQSPVGNYVNFGSGSEPYPTQAQAPRLPVAHDGTPFVSSEEDLKYVHGWFYDPNGTRRWKP